MVWCLSKYRNNFTFTFVNVTIMTKACEGKEVLYSSHNFFFVIMWK
jgi:hypothetical protein